MRTRFVAIVFALVAAGCSERSAFPSPSTTARTVYLNGVVYDLSAQPLAGARVQLADAGPSDSPAMTGNDGRFTLGPGRSQGNIIRVQKDGYVTQDATCCDVYLVREGQPALASGSYTLNVTFDPACTFVPAELRTQNFQATVGPLPRFVPVWGVSIQNAQNTARAYIDLGLVADDRGISVAEESYMFWEVPLARYFNVGLYSEEPVDLLNPSFSAVLNYCQTAAQSRFPWNEYRCSSFFKDAPADPVLARGVCWNNRVTLTRNTR